MEYTKKGGRLVFKEKSVWIRTLEQFYTFLFEMYNHVVLSE